MTDCIQIVEQGTELAEELLRFVENCSWDEAKEHIAQNIREWTFTDWETMFAAIRDGKIVGMASVMKTDYYPLPEVFPWVSCIFVSEEYRGQRISGELIACANRYLKEHGFHRSYIPSAFTGLYEHYGYRYLRDIVNYGGGIDRLYIKELGEENDSTERNDAGDEKMIEAARTYVKRLFQNNSGGHDAEHTMRVYRNALLIAGQEPDCDLEIVSMAALLHDADDHKLFDTRNNANARSFLEEQNVDPNKAERIIAAINAVSFSQNRGKKPETLEGKIVQDADRLDAIGAVGIARTFAFGGEHGRSLDASIQHFYDKLLLLKDEMNTKSGQELAEDRHFFMVRFLEE